MKKWIAVLLCCIFLFFLSAGNTFADDIYEDDPITGVFTNKDMAVAKGQLPKTDAGAVLVMDTVSGRILYEKNGFSKRAMASTTKIMTAILALEKGDLNDKVTISKRAAGIWGSTIKLKTGQTMEFRDLLYGLMLNSGNDAAIAIAEHIGGSVEGFAEMMNAKAAELGAKDTHFKTPHGLDQPDHYSTAYDMATIARYALQNPQFSKIVATTNASIPNRNLHNTNELLGAYPGADGVKTGYTGLAGRCLVASATRENWRVISVVLGSPSRTKRAQSSVNLLDYAFSNYKLYSLLKKGERVANLPVVKGLELDVGIQTTEDIVYPLRYDEAEVLQTEIDLPDRLMAPVAAGSEVGSVSFLVNGKVVAKSALKAVGGVPRKTFMDYMKDILRGWR